MFIKTGIELLVGGWNFCMEFKRLKKILHIVVESFHTFKTCLIRIILNAAVVKKNILLSPAYTANNHTWNNIVLTEVFMSRVHWLYKLWTYTVPWNKKYNLNLKNNNRKLCFCIYKNRKYLLIASRKLLTKIIQLAPVTFI